MKVRKNEPLRNLPGHETNSSAITELVESITNKLSRDIAEAIRTEIHAHSTKSEAQSLLTVREVANYLSVSIRTVETLISEGLLEPIRIRGARRFSVEGIESFITACQARNGQEVAK